MQDSAVPTEGLPLIDGIPGFHAAVQDMRQMAEHAATDEYPWLEPASVYVSEDGGVVMEWYVGKRKITLYRDVDEYYCVRVPLFPANVTGHTLHSSVGFSKHWIWLHSD